MADKQNLNALLDDIRNFDFNDVDWNNMGSWPIVGKVILCLILSGGILALGYFLLISTEPDSLARSQANEEKLRKEFENKAFRVANLNEYKTQLEEMQTTFGALLKQLPQDTEIPGLIDDISAAALNSGLVLKTMDPQALKTTEFYKELPINIEVEGDYHQMGAFVSGVAAMPRIVTLHDFSISRSGKGAEKLSMKILAKTYQYNSDKEK